MITLKHIELLLIGTFDSLKLLGMVLILFNVCLLLLGGHSEDKDVYYPYVQILCVYSEFPFVLLESHNEDKDI